jgi:beta-galactosidase/beta-glucuronidase
MRGTRSVAIRVFLAGAAVWTLSGCAGSEDTHGRHVPVHPPGDLRHLGEYSRPDLVREGMQALLGEWKLEYDPEDVGLSEGWAQNPAFSRKITVPFCVEAEASGIGDPDPPGILWYAKRFQQELPEVPGHTLLHFGAVDYRAQVWLNGRYLGEHAGGYTPFRFEVHDVIDRDNLLVVRVEDFLGPDLPRGKQSQFGFPFSVFYETVTGIWQPVWMERTGSIYLDSYRVFPDLRTGKVRIVCRLAGGPGHAEVKVEAGSPLGERRAETAHVSKAGEEKVAAQVILDFGQLLPWSPGDPALYGLEFTISSEDSLDEVHGYFGVRTVETRDGDIRLNGERLYQRLVLHQGYYPGGHYTPTEPALFRKDIELVKAFGFNGLRMHQKIEDPRLLFWADMLGALVWEEMPSAHALGDSMREALEREWREAIDRDFNHPSIITWVPFNESWGVGLGILPILVFQEAKDFVKQICRRTREWDPTRLVIDNSGYDHTSETDVVDVHHYLGTVERCAALYEELEDLYAYEWSPLRWILSLNAAESSQNVFTWEEGYSGQPVIISEYGGFGYYDVEGEGSLIENYRAYTELILEQDHLDGYCYTQFSDTYQERNGLTDAYRLPKVPPEEIRRINTP